MATKNDVKDAVREVLNEANGEGGSLRVQTRWTHILLKRLYDRLYGAHPTLGDPNKRWHSLSFLRRTQYDASMVRGDTAALRSETAALRELLGELLERDPSNPLTRADLDEAIERGMRRVEVQVRVVDEIDPPEGDEAPPDPDDDA